MAQPTVAPQELISSTDSGVPRRFRVQLKLASAHASRMDLRHSGPDFEIDSFRPLSALEEGGRPLTYLASRRFASALFGRSELTVVTTPELAGGVPEGNGVVLTTGSPRDVFYALFEGAHESFETLESFISPAAKISPAAAISPHVYVSEGAEIGAGAVLLPGTYIGPDVVVKPNAVIGGDGFETASGRGRAIVRHAGGVWLEAGVQAGSCTCIDKGLFGDFTFIGARTLIDNLVHFAHSARAGRSCSIIAGAEISGSVILGDGVWVGPNAAINQGLHIADHCYIGTGSVVTRNLEGYSLAYGAPAKFSAWVCECRAKLSFENGRAACGDCGKAYLLADHRVRRA